MKKVVYLDLHVIQSVPPSCLNRDDTGSPKTAIYGGARRARVSSQAWKRAMRRMFCDYLDMTELGINTKYLNNMIANEIIKLKPDTSEDSAKEMAQKIIKEIPEKSNAKNESKTSVKNKDKDKNKAKDDSKAIIEDKVKTLFYIGRQQAKNLAKYALDQCDSELEKNEIIDRLNKDKPIDMALFGRMVADNHLLCSDACAQVAHAISTHRVENEYDFFTAIDDLAPDDNKGAAMLDSIEYCSATLYRYATVAACRLYDELGEQREALIRAVREFTRAFIFSIPTGKQNTFAAQTIPDSVMVAIRTDRPINLVGAFEKPVHGEGLVQPSIIALENYTQTIYSNFCSPSYKTYIVGNYLSKIGERLTAEQLIETIGDNVAEAVII